MTIQEYKNTLQCWLTTFADCGVTTDAIYGAQLMFNYAIEMAQNNLSNFEVNELENGKCYMVTFPSTISPEKMREWVMFYNKAVSYRGITVLPKLSSTKIEAVNRLEKKVYE